MTKSQGPKVDVEAVLQLALPLIKKWEGFRSKPYLDAVGVPTIGYGSTYYDSGTKVTMSDPEITEEFASLLIEYTVLKTYLPAVMESCPNLVEPNQIAALVSFTYNLGGKALAGSTLRKRILEGNFDAVPAEFRRWINAGGKPLPGLIKRREDEIKLFTGQTV